VQQSLPVEFSYCTSRGYIAECVSRDESGSPEHAEDAEQRDIASSYEDQEQTDVILLRHHTITARWRAGETGEGRSPLPYCSMASKVGILLASRAAYEGHVTRILEEIDDCSVGDEEVKILGILERLRLAQKNLNDTSAKVLGSLTAEGDVTEEVNCRSPTQTDLFLPKFD